MDPIVDVLNAAYTDVQLRHAISVLDKNSSSNGTRYGQRTVRSQAEHDVLARSAVVLNQMRPLAQTLSTLGGRVSESLRVYDELLDIVNTNATKMAPYAESARFLRSEQRDTAKQAQMLDAYMDALYVSPQDRSIIENTSTDELSPDFFVVLERLKRIHSQSAAVLLAEAPRNGEHLMEDVSKLLDVAYAHIKTVIDAELRSGRRTNQLRKHMTLLADRPLLFKAVLQEQSGLRRTQLSRDFTKFLSIEQPNAHAMPVRYLGAVLAWVHAAIVNEFEYISLLLDPETQPEESEPAATRSFEQLLSTSDTRKIIVELVDGVISSLESRLRQQIHAVTVSQTDAVVVDELQSVLQFYEQMLAKYELRSLETLLTQLTQSIDAQFIHLLAISSASWEDCVDVALGILRTHDRGVYRDDILTQRRLDAVLDEPLQKEIAKASPIQALNTLDFAIGRLAGYIVAQKKLDLLRNMQAEYESKEVKREVSEMKQQSKLAELQNGNISAHEFVAAIDEFLGYAQIDMQDRLEALQSPTVVNRISQRSIAEFVTEYELAIKDIPSARPAEEVRTLLA